MEYGIALLICAAVMYTITIKKELRKGDIVISIALGIAALDSLICREYFFN